MGFLPAAEEATNAFVIAIGNDAVQSAQKVVLAGRLCDPIDVFPTSARSKLGGAEFGKLVIFRDVGAYSLVMNMAFHSQPKPFVLMRTGQGEFVVARRGMSAGRLFEEKGGDCLPD